MKKTKPWQIALLCILAVVIYTLPMLFIFVIGYMDEKEKTFEIKGDIIEISKGHLIIEKQDSFYNEEDETYYITGYLKNTTENEYNGISIEYRVYDGDGNIIGDAVAYLEALDSKQTWKFKAVYQDIDAEEISKYEFIRIYYY